MAGEVLEKSEINKIVAELVALPQRSLLRLHLPISNPNVVLVTMFVIGVVAVFLLRLGTGGPQAASAQQQQAEMQVDNAISQFAGSLDTAQDPSEMALVTDTFYYEASQRHIPAWRLAGNPFVFTMPMQEKPQLAVSSSKSDVLPLKPLSKAERRKRALAEAEKLVLQSVLMGPSGRMAMISNNLLSKGQNIAGWTVLDIQPKAVVITWENKTYTLKIR